MIHAIVFANRSGYHLFERTADFPETFRKDIQEICDRLQAFDGLTDTALRYMPLRDRYLLSVILRLKHGNADCLRSHVCAVNFLLEQEDADAMFAGDLRQTADLAVKAARKLMEVRDCALPEYICRELLQAADPMPSMPQEAGIPLPTLMTGAYYGAGAKLTKQLFIQSTGDPLEELQVLCGNLPPALRRTLRFHTDCVSAAESHGITLCFSSRLEEIISSYFSQGPDTTKFWVFPPDGRIPSKIDSDLEGLAARLAAIPERVPVYGLLMGYIPNWKTSLNLSQLLREKADPSLAQALELLPEEDMLAFLHSGLLDETELTELVRTAGKRKLIARTAREALAELQPEGGNRAPAWRYAVGGILGAAAAYLLLKWIL